MIANFQRSLNRKIKSPNSVLFYTIAITIIFSSSCRNESLPSINIKKTEAIPWEQKEPCEIIYTDKNKTISLAGKIKCRGGFSSGFYKHSFSLELEDKYSLGDLPKDDDWIINANYIDKTFMRHKISYDLFREMSPNNIAPKSAYITVCINDNYEGLYLLMEEVNASMVGLDKNDTLAILLKDPPIFREEKLLHPQEINNYQQKSPKITEVNQTYYIESFMTFMFYSSDKDFTENISSWVDIENVIDWHIILLFSNNGDGILKNFYLYKLNKDTPFRFALWDYDHSFGRDGDNERNLMERELDCNRAILLKRLSEIPETGYLPKLKKRWIELRKLNIISIDNFQNHVTTNNKLISNEIEKNFEKWPVDNKWYYDNNNYEQELNLMLNFVEIRITQLDEYFEGL